MPSVHLSFSLDAFHSVSEDAASSPRQMYQRDADEANKSVSLQDDLIGPSNTHGEVVFQSEYGFLPAETHNPLRYSDGSPMMRHDIEALNLASKPKRSPWLAKSVRINREMVQLLAFALAATLLAFAVIVTSVLHPESLTAADSYRGIMPVHGVPSVRLSHTAGFLSAAPWMPAMGLGVGGMAVGQTEEAVRVWIASGGRRVDCGAPSADNLAEVGRALASSRVPRSSLFISLTLPLTLQHGADGADQSHSAKRERAAALASAAEAEADTAMSSALAQLALAHVDLLLIPNAGPGSAGRAAGQNGTSSSQQGRNAAAWAAAEGLHHKGKARAIGVANFGAQELRDLHHGAGSGSGSDSDSRPSSVRTPAVNAVEYHPYSDHANHHEALRAYCTQHSVALQAFSPLAAGDPAVGLVHDPVLADVGRQRGVNLTSAQVALRWLWDSHDTTCTVRSTSAGHMALNLQIYQASTLPQNSMERIDKLAAAKGASSRLHKITV